MGSYEKNKPRVLSPHHRTPCTPTHQIFALLLIVITYFITSFSLDQDRSSQKLLRFNGRYLSWPERGFGSHLSLKIYVYDEDEIDGLDTLMYGISLNLTAEDCDKGRWGTQVKIHRLLLQSRFRTSNKEEADLFFVPAYVKCIMVMAGMAEEVINQTYVQVISQMPYFKRSGGRDHIFVFPSGAGAHFFTSWETFINRSIFLTPEADRTDRISSTAFNTWKDIIIPGNVNDNMTTDGAFRVHPLPLSMRKYLANYLGHAQGKLPRLQLIELAKQYPDKLECPDLTYDFANKFEKMEYFQHLRNAKFCLVPRGLSSWTLRFYEAFFVECVPVILSDQIELPFQNVIDYTQFTIKWPATQIGPQLLEYLESIPDDDLKRMIAHGKEEGRGSLPTNTCLSKGGIRISFLVKKWFRKCLSGSETKTQSMGKFARLYVEIGVSKPLVGKVRVDCRAIRVEVGGDCNKSERSNDASSKAGNSASGGKFGVNGSGASSSGSNVGGSRFAVLEEALMTNSEVAGEQ
ncbi:hypothetical protein ACOSP7_009679 [Xanthoceras sorbifolium]